MVHGRPLGKNSPVIVRVQKALAFVVAQATVRRFYLASLEASPNSVSASANSVLLSPGQGREGLRKPVDALSLTDQSPHQTGLWSSIGGFWGSLTYRLTTTEMNLFWLAGLLCAYLSSQR